MGICEDKSGIIFFQISVIYACFATWAIDLLSDICNDQLFV